MAFNIFKKKKQNNKINSQVTAKIIYTNDLIEVVHDACKLCYDKQPEVSRKGKIEYVERRVASGHESILEHTNVISILTFDKSLRPELDSIMECFRYLNIKISENEKNINLLIGGSIRGYKHITRTIKNGNNVIYKSILNLMYQLHHCFFKDFIDDEILEEDKFISIMEDEVLSEGGKESEVIKRDFNFKNKNQTNTTKCDIKNIDDFDYIYNELTYYGFTKYDIMDMCCINILFKDISRAASQQLVRHRAGITQLSQRYVDMSNATIVSPEDSKPEKYKNKKYTINFGGMKKTVSMQELGDYLINTVYSQLREQEVLKEDARAFLPFNTKTSLYMTFSFRGFIKFLELRTNKAAQSEIREIATELEDKFKPIINESDIYSYVLPYYKFII